MIYTLRFVWYVLRIALIVLVAFAVLVAAFFIAMDSADVYVIVTDGMKARAASALTPGAGADLDTYFSNGYLHTQPQIDKTPYQGYLISDFDYKLTIESLWCNPWKNTATVTVVESIPSMKYSTVQSDTAVSGADKAQVSPQWPHVRYRIQCVRVDNTWRIDSLTVVEKLPQEPTASPEPSNYITLAPTLLPSPSVAPSATPTPKASAAG